MTNEFSLCILGTPGFENADTIFEFMDEWVENNTMPTHIITAERRGGINDIAIEWANCMGITHATFNSTNRAESEQAMGWPDQVIVIKNEARTDIWVRRMMQFATNKRVPCQTYELVVNE
tara:strand:+ start:523 stop:882 length:360 start_codon:yes stop_codon:yes gene_type:complete